MVSTRVWLAMMKPFRPKKRFFRRLDLTKQRSFNDTENKQYVSDPMVRTLRIDPVDGRPVWREPIRRNDPEIDLVADAGGDVEHDIRPVGTEAWEIESISINHNAVGNENFDMLYVDETPGPIRLHQLFDAEGFGIQPVTHTQLFPYYHDLIVGNHDAHLWAIAPLVVRHLVYIRIANVGPLPVGTGVNLTYMYRRIKL